MKWRPDLILKIILILCAVDMTLLWLPFIRGMMDGSSYEWGYMGLSGNGMTDDYWILIIMVLFGSVVQYLGWRGAKKPFHLLLLIWNLPALYFALQILMQREEIIFKGDTLGLSIPLDLPVAILYGGVFILVIYWIINDVRKKRKRLNLPWTKRNGLLFFLGAAVIPIQFLLLRNGEPHGTTDQIGVLLTILQWFLFVGSLYPFSPEKSPMNKR